MIEELEKSIEQMTLKVLFYIVIFGHFIADYAVWALLIVEGRTFTYNC